MKKHLHFKGKLFSLAATILFTVQYSNAQWFGENIIPNSGFDEPVTNWVWDVSINSSEATGSVSVEDEALKISVFDMGDPVSGLNENQAAALYQYDEVPFNGFVGAWYMALDAKSSNDTTPLKVGLRARAQPEPLGEQATNFNAINKKFSNEDYITQDIYTNYHGYTYTNPKFMAAQAEVRIMVGGQVGEVNFDNIELRPVLDIVNSSFEHDSLLFGWELSTNDSASISTDTVQIGEQALKVMVETGQSATITSEYLHYEGYGADTVTFFVSGDVGDTVLFNVQPWVFESPASEYKIKNNIADVINIDTLFLPEGADTTYIGYQVIIDTNDIDPGTDGDLVFLQYEIVFIGDGPFFIDNINYKAPKITSGFKDITTVAGVSYTREVQTFGTESISLSLITDAGWLSLTNETIKGTPSISDTGIYNVKVVATDGNIQENDTVSYNINVIYTAPSILTELYDTIVNAGNKYIRVIETNGSLKASLSILSEATWLSVDKDSIKGTPSAADTGTFNVKVVASDGFISENDTVSYNITVQDPTLAIQNRMEDNATENCCIIYPNPATDIVFISTKKMSGTIKILDIAGNLIKTIVPGSNEIEFDISAFDNGTYFVVISQDNDVIVKKLQIR